MSRWRQELVGPEPAPLLAVLAGYLASRLVFIVGMGVEFDATPLTWFWQYLDPVLLESDALRSLFYLHSQPPLYNAWLAVGIKLGGDAPDWLFWLGNIAAGGVLHGAIWRTAVLLGARPWLASAGALLFALSPASILYESWLFYTYPTAALVIAAAPLAFFAMKGGFCSRRALGFLMLCAAIVLTRTLFHWTFFVAMAGALVLVASPQRQRALRVAALPALLIGLVLLKNLLLFGSFGTSSWLGMNLARVALEPIPTAERRVLVKRGELDTVTLIAPFSPLERYPEALRIPDSPMGAKALQHPAVSRPFKSTRAVNFNHAAYAEISRRYRAGALATIRRDPGRYLDQLEKGWLIFAMPASEYWFLDRNREKIAAYEAFWDAAILGVSSTFTGAQVAYDRKDPRYLRARSSVFGVVAASLGLAWGGLRLIGAYRRFRRGGDAGELMLIVYLMGTAGYVILVGNALDFRENNRMRFLIEPILMTLIIATVSSLLDRVRGSSSTATTA